MTPIAIPAALLDRIYAHARRTFPAECCGYLAGDPVTDLVECHNAEEHDPDRRFVIDGKELFALARSFDTARPARVVYHSHTNGRAYFSPTDRAMALGADGPAYPVQHLVIGITADAITEAALFGWSDDARDFVELARWTP
jgi:proteasome lid subunit RPN8/RPN11